MVMNQEVKILMYWNIRPGRDQEYFEFVVREWIPGITRLGIEPTGAWLTVYSQTGTLQQMMAEGRADSAQLMRDIMDNPDWQLLQDRLLEYVTDYRQKVVRLTGGFQM